MAEQAFEARRLAGPLSVAYRQVSSQKWYAIALQFDLVGLGRSRERAFEELQSMVNDYLIEIANTSGPVRFFNPSPAEDWQEPDQEFFTVEIVILRSAEKPSRLKIIRPLELPQISNRIKGISLSPLYA